MSDYIEFHNEEEASRKNLIQKQNDLALNFLLFFSNDINKKHDGYLFSGITSSEQKHLDFQRYIFELKKRNCRYSTMLIEKDKYEHLVERCDYHKDKNLKPLYINDIEDEIIAWDLTNHKDIKWKYKLMPKTTAHKKKMEYKWVGYLPINQSFKIG